MDRLGNAIFYPSADCSSHIDAGLLGRSISLTSCGWTVRNRIVLDRECRLGRMQSVLGGTAESHRTSVSWWRRIELEYNCSDRTVLRLDTAEKIKIAIKRCPRRGSSIDHGASCNSAIRAAGRCDRVGGSGDTHHGLGCAALSHSQGSLLGAEWKHRALCHCESAPALHGSVARIRTAAHLSVGRL